VRAPIEPRVRTEIVKRRLAWEADPAGFNREWSGQQAALREQVLHARELLPEVTIAEGLLLLISELCCSQGVASLRADLVMNKAVRALAALGGRVRVEPGDISEAAMLVLPHRRRTKPFEQPGLDEEQLQRFMQKASLPMSGEGPYESDSQPVGDRTAHDGTSSSGHAREPGETDAASHHNATGGRPDAGDINDRADRGGRSSQNAQDRQAVDRVFAPGATAPVPRIELKSGAVAAGILGRRSAVAEARRGREVRAVPDERPTELAVTATLHHSLLRTGGLAADGRLEVTRADLHQKVKAGRQGSLILFVVDASGSMAALQRMEAVKGAVVALLRDAYQRRDEVGVIAFRGTEAKLLLPPTRSVDAAECQLRELPTGGRTPLAHALQLADDVLTRASGVSRGEPLLIILSDGHANVGLDGPGGRLDPWRQSLDCAGRLAEKGWAALVLDTEVGFVRMGRAQELAAALGAQYLTLDELTTDTLTLTIRGRLRDTSQRRPGQNV
jgi:magnesium chelatase subunit D